MLLRAHYALSAAVKITVMIYFHFSDSLIVSLFNLHFPRERSQNRLQPAFQDDHSIPAIKMYARDLNFFFLG